MRSEYKINKSKKFCRCQLYMYENIEKIINWEYKVLLKGVSILCDKRYIIEDRR